MNVLGGELRRSGEPFGEIVLRRRSRLAALSCRELIGLGGGPPNDRAQPAQRGSSKDQLAAGRFRDRLGDRKAQTLAQTLAKALLVQSDAAKGGCGHAFPRYARTIIVDVQIQPYLRRSGPDRDATPAEPHGWEWGEWTAVGGFAYASVPQIPAAGNHEYSDDDAGQRQLGPLWSAQFALPANGVTSGAAQPTTYYTDYQGVRFIVLDGTAALSLGALDEQRRWLDRTLAESQARWNIVVQHQPIYTCARPRDTEALKAAWNPIFVARRVDLVLQGHDHCYSRISNPEGAEAGRASRAAGEPQGPVYLVSVTGSKMYGLNDRAGSQPDRVAADTQMYQTIDVSADRLVFRAYTATGELYDAFDLNRLVDGSNQLTDAPQPLPIPRLCREGAGPDGGVCLGRPR